MSTEASLLPWNSSTFPRTPVMLFTGKGGVGKTSLASATAVALADEGRRVLLVSTDPASNLQDVFMRELSAEPTPIAEVTGLSVANIDPMAEAAAYRESVVGPLRGLMPEDAIASIEEQLSGSCTVEIATFQKFMHFLTDADLRAAYDHIIFDTAPTGHTIRLLELPTAWAQFVQTNTHGASCLGPLSGLADKEALCVAAVKTLQNTEETTLVLVTRAEEAALTEAQRTGEELRHCGLTNQVLVVNGVMALALEDEKATAHDALLAARLSREVAVLASLSSVMQPALPTYGVALKTFNTVGLSELRALLARETLADKEAPLPVVNAPGLDALVAHLQATQKRLIFTMGKGGVGKTTIAAAIALQLASAGKEVLLATTDPAAHIAGVAAGMPGITLQAIDPEAALLSYQTEVLTEAKKTLGAAELAYLEEDLRSPCTQEIAVFRAFANLVQAADEKIVVIDTAPTGHTLLLLDATMSYQREVERTKGVIPASVRNLLPRLRGPECAMVIVTLAEATPFLEAARLADDLERASLPVAWWVVNQSYLAARPTSSLLRTRAECEAEWLEKIRMRAASSGASVSVVAARADAPRGDALKTL